MPHLDLDYDYKSTCISQTKRHLLSLDYSFHVWYLMPICYSSGLNLHTDTTLAITLMTLVLCTRRAGEQASRYAGLAGWFWVPFTVVLFAMQVSLQLFAVTNSDQTIYGSELLTLAKPVGSWHIRYPLPASHLAFVCAGVRRLQHKQRRHQRRVERIRRVHLLRVVSKRFWPTVLG